jgi:hypothetical protein
MARLASNDKPNGECFQRTLSARGQNYMVEFRFADSRQRPPEACAPRQNCIDTAEDGTPSGGSVQMRDF